MRTIFHKVAQRPGKPLWFGAGRLGRRLSRATRRNPVSTLVCFTRYVLPALLGSLGHNALGQPNASRSVRR